MEVPDGWIPPKLTSAGFLPDVGVHLRGSMLIQETSRSTWVSAGVMFVLAVIALVPASQLGLDIPYFVQVFVAIGFTWGGICLRFIAPLIQRKFGQTVLVDLVKETVTIVRLDERTVIPVAAVVGLQLLQAPAGQRGFQLNLICRRGLDSIERFNLTTNAFRKYVLRVATAYQRALGWPLLQ